MAILKLCSELKILKTQQSRICAGFCYVLEQVSGVSLCEKIGLSL